MPENKCTGTEASYVRGCRCDECKQARSLAVKRRNLEKRAVERPAPPKPPEEKKVFRLPRRDEYGDTLTRGQLYKFRGY